MLVVACVYLHSLGIKSQQFDPEIILGQLQIYIILMFSMIIWIHYQRGL